MADITPPPRAGRQIISAYGDGGFRIAGVTYRGSVLVLPDRTLAWPVAAVADITPESLAPLGEAELPVELLLLGCGSSIGLPPQPVRAALKEAGVALERMDTGAACRTFNVLLAEERRVAAALIAVA